MICVVIKGPTINDVERQLTTLNSQIKLIELRLDCIEHWTIEWLQALLCKNDFSFIFTLRSREQGGEYNGDEAERLILIQHLLKLNPTYFDLECHIPLDQLRNFQTNFPLTQWIFSFHHFTNEEVDLGAIYLELKEKPAQFYKIAIQVNNSVEALKIVQFQENKSDLIAIPMGEYGQFARLLCYCNGSPLIYARHDETSANFLGQLSVDELLNNYHFHTLNFKTKWYALIGNPVTSSIGHIAHNKIYAQYNWNAIYVKISVLPEELHDFLALAKNMRFFGLSVTMPLKEIICSLMDDLEFDAEKIGAVNTIVFDRGKMIGFNTDGKGALDAIEVHDKVVNKTIIVLGAGGAAKAIIYEAVKRKASVVVINRNFQKALLIAQRFNCLAEKKIKSLEHRNYNYLINCTSISMPIDEQEIVPFATIMDIQINPLQTDLLIYAQRKNCPVIYGYRMFVEQALGQIKLWFKNFLSEQMRLQLSIVCINYLNKKSL